jgi:hypothetical protein
VQRRRSGLAWLRHSSQFKRLIRAGYRRRYGRVQCL